MAKYVVERRGKIVGQNVEAIWVGFDPDTDEDCYDYLFEDIWDYEPEILGVFDTDETARKFLKDIESNWIKEHQRPWRNPHHEALPGGAMATTFSDGKDYVVFILRKEEGS
jgi:hypothetical protein